MSAMTGTDPYATSVGGWWKRDEQAHAAQVAVQPEAPPSATVRRIHAGLVKDQYPFYAAAVEEHYGPKPAATGDRGVVRSVLARMASAAAATANPIFHASCWDCVRSGGWCPMHREMRDEHDAFTRLAARITTAATDRDALLLFAAFAEGDVQAPPVGAWGRQQNHVAELLTEAENNLLPASVACCPDDNPCPEHAAAVERAGFIGAIRDAVIDARSPHEAAELIAQVITTGDAQ